MRKIERLENDTGGKQRKLEEVKIEELISEIVPCTVFSSSLVIKLCKLLSLIGKCWRVLLLCLFRATNGLAHC